MPFSFTFQLNVPGISNPFATLTSPEQTPSNPPIDRPLRALGHSTRRHPSPAPSLSAIQPLSRKRGWAPSSPEPSQSTTTIASTSGYLDTPAKYKEMAAATNQQAGHDEYIDETAELPPMKRRRTLAGSIVDTALSAALIGTAVGLTVYRLWRDRGKEPAQQQILSPPPPYQQGEWVPAPQKQTIQVSPSTPRGRKARTLASTKRPTTHHRRPRVRPNTFEPTRSESPSSRIPVQPDFNMNHASDNEPAVEDQMDWIGDKLSMLIEEGKKALGKEIVVMSDSREDEVDDGTGAWEEMDAPAAGPSSYSAHSRSGSLRHPKRPRNIHAPPPPSYPSPRFVPSSPRSGHLSSGSGSFPITPPRATQGVSVDASFISSSFREDQAAWESPELRESMEKARMRLLRNRA